MLIRNGPLLMHTLHEKAMFDVSASLEFLEHISKSTAPL
jgi:hypothetical protein